MMTRSNINMTLPLFFFSVLILFSACVPQQRVTELEQTLDYYKTESLEADSIRGVNERLVTENNQTQADMRGLTQRMEQLTATNISLNRNYQDLVVRYNELVGENQQVLATTSYETTNLQQQLAARQTELDQKERRLDEMEYVLREREDELRRVEARGGAPSPYNTQGQSGDPRYTELQSRKAAIDQELQLLQDRLRQVLVGFPQNEVSVAERNGQVIVTLSQPLLFPQSNEEVHWKGRQALQQIAVVLRDNPNLTTQVRGHTYATTNNAYDWQLSAIRALAVTRDLVTYGVAPGQLLAAGKGATEPVAPASNPQATALNSRTELILQPDYSSLLDAIGE